MTETIRINKFFTEHGICSRREADRLIEAGRVTINNVVATLGDQVSSRDVIARDGQVIPWSQSRVYIKYHKPVGVTTTSEAHVPRISSERSATLNASFRSAGSTRTLPASFSSPTTATS